MSRSNLSSRFLAVMAVTSVTWPLHLLLLVSVMTAHTVLSQAVFSLVETTYAVREGDQFAVEIKKAGTAASAVNVVVQVILCSFF